MKAAVIQKRDAVAERLAGLEAELENTGIDGEHQNQFISSFHPYAEAEIETLTKEMLIVGLRTPMHIR